MFVKKSARRMHDTIESRERRFEKDDCVYLTMKGFEKRIWSHGGEAPCVAGEWRRRKEIMKRWKGK
jgi:hypothetical protein